MATNCSKRKFFQDSKELKGHNAPGEVVHTERSVHWTLQTNFDEFLYEFSMKKSRTKTLCLFTVLCSGLVDCSFLFRNAYFNRIQSLQTSLIFKPEPDPSPTFIFEARFTPESRMYRVSRDMRNCRVSKNVQYGRSCRCTVLSYPK